eukprot:TRINITY_DN17095_c0_g1_i1.p1 TRINITY_DN17095_c0_g1~~TRINITY_DN17095_c0_g1_i1.p1  ORF type:complete len:115 (+),score=8.89 TRINITY_DN17095_c0_g1_i1:350-694(+)
MLNLYRSIVAPLDEGIDMELQVLKIYVYEKVIRSHRIQVDETSGYHILIEMFKMIYVRPSALPEDFRQIFDSCGDCEATQKRVVCDFIASMSDLYAREFYSRLRGGTGSVLKSI